MPGPPAPFPGMVRVTGHGVPYDFQLIRHYRPFTLTVLPRPSPPASPRGPAPTPASGRPEFRKVTKVAASPIASGVGAASL